MGFLFVGFVGCVLLLFFLWVSLFVCLFCAGRRTGGEEGRGFLVDCFVFRKNGESIMASDGIYHLVSVHCIRACTGCHCQT